MSDNEYVMSTKAVGNMSDTLSIQTAEYLRVIEETTAIVDELAAHWEGATYQTFRDGYYNHLADLEELNKSLKTLANELYDKAQKTRNTVKVVQSIIK